MTAAQRHNARQNRIFETAKRLKAERDDRLFNVIRHLEDRAVTTETEIEAECLIEIANDPIPDLLLRIDRSIISLGRVRDALERGESPLNHAPTILQVSEGLRIVYALMTEPERLASN